MSSTILYIEDNEQNYYLVSFILKARGHTVSWAKDGRAGIDAAVAARPDLVLLDIQLPVMDGYAVAREIRSRPELAATPLIALTSYAMPGDRAKAMQAGFTGYIEKPINPMSFAADIEQVLEAKRGADGGATRTP